MAVTQRALSCFCRVRHKLINSFIVRNESTVVINNADTTLANSTSATNVVITQKEKNLYMIGINRPEKRNCVNKHTALELIKAFQAYENDETAEAAVLYGVGGNFCAGYDLSEIAECELHDNIPTEFGPMGPSRMLTSKPVIAAVSGYAVAGGLELALACDLRVVEETAIMGVFCRRFGVPLLDGGTVRLPQIIGLSRALDLILTGRAIDAKEAKEFGLANHVVACGTAIGKAVNLAKCIAKFPQECLKADRRSAYYSVFEAKSLEDAFQFEFENGKQVLYKESVRGAQKFMNGLGKHGKFNFDKQLMKQE